MPLLAIVSPTRSTARGTPCRQPLLLDDREVPTLDVGGLRTAQLVDLEDQAGHSESPEGSVTMTRPPWSFDSEEWAERRAPTGWWGRAAAAWVLSRAVVSPMAAAEPGDRGGSEVQPNSSQGLAQAVLLHRGRARGAGRMRALRAELLGLREELARLDVDPSPDRVGRPLGHRDAAAMLLAETLASAPARHGEPAAVGRAESPKGAPPGGRSLETFGRILSQPQPWSYGPGCNPGANAISLTENPDLQDFQRGVRSPSESPARRTLPWISRGLRNRTPRC